MNLFMLVSLKFVINCCVLLISMVLSAVANADIQALLDKGAFSQAEQQIKQELAAQSDEQEKIYLLTLYGDLWFYQKQFDTALNKYHQALDYAKGLVDDELQAEQMKNIAIAYSEQKAYGKALQWHELAKQLLGADSISNTNMSILLSQAMIFSQVGAPELAAETLVEAQHMAYRLSNHAGLNNSYLRLAALHMRNHDLAAAKVILEKVNLAVMLGMDDVLWYYILSTEVALGFEDLELAEKLLHEFEVKSNGSKYQHDSGIQVIKAHLLILQSEHEKAGVLIEDLTLSYAVQPWVIMQLRGLWFKSQNQHINAFTAYQQAVELFHSTHQSNRNQSVFKELPGTLLQQTIAAAVDVGFDDMEQLYQWVFALHHARQPKFTNRAQANETKTATNSDHGFTEVVTDVISGQMDLKQYLDFNLTELQLALNADECMLVMVEVNNKLLVLMVTMDNVQLVELKSDMTQLNQQISQFINQIIANEVWLPLAQSIEEQVILPLRTHGLDRFKKLHVIADGNLRFLPFDALMDQHGKFLLDRHVVNLHSIHSLPGFIENRSKEKLTNEPHQKTRLSFLGSSATFDQAPSYWRTAYRNLDFEQLNYPGVLKEHQYIKSLKLGGVIKLNQQANESTAVEIIENETGILHLAGHGFDNPVAPAFSAFLLAADEQDDGLLQAREVARLNTALSVVVLASCSSAKGGLAGRYGFQLGLSEAFLQAGTEAVIGTLWDVKDQNTQQFMQWFYQNLIELGQPAESLRLAKQQAISQHWQLSDWSAFVLLGDGSIQLNLSTEDEDIDSWLSAITYLLMVLVLLVMGLKISQYLIKD